MSIVLNARLSSIVSIVSQPIKVVAVLFWLWLLSLLWLLLFFMLLLFLLLKTAIKFRPNQINNSWNISVVVIVVLILLLLLWLLLIPETYL